ncbi:MAG: hypothetical protein VX346_20675 [Planctomycetota bacterium]|nr:hypothetical protein [Planctomycetota bacterium]
MDRSFLADQEVIAASRKFVCIRLATYEDAAESRMLRGIFAPGGNLQNTVFAILTPDGKTPLVRSGRSPVWAFGGVRGPGINAQPLESIKKMARAMEAIWRRYPGNGRDAQDSRPIPYLADLRIALNVAAADRQPLVVVYSPDRAQRTRMERELAQVAWFEPFVGKVQYVAAQVAREFQAVQGFQARAGFIVIQPGTFGLTGKVLDAVPPDTLAAELRDALAKALNQHRPSQLTYNQHRQAGMRAGVRWQSRVPNTARGGRQGDRRRRRRPRR